MSTPMLPRTFLTIALAVSSFAPATIRAGQAPPPQTPQTPPTFRAGIDLVQVDVSVLDKSGAPIHGLKADDFVVREDGTPQKVEYFDEIVAPEAAPPSAPWMTTVSSDVSTNDLQDRRIFAIVLDDAMMINWPEAIKNAKTIARETIARMGPNDLASVIFTRDTTLAQEFTSDKTRLLAAVDKLTFGFAFAVDRAKPEPNSATKPPNPDEYWYKVTAQVLANVAEDLIAILQRRKVLVYVSIGVPFSLDSAASATMGSGGDLEERELMMGIREKMEHAINRAQRANVTVYAFEPGGHYGLEGFFKSGLAHNPPPTPIGRDPAEYAADILREYVTTIADNTGGRAVVNTSDFTAGIDRMFRENASYYLLGYRQSNPKRAGEYSRLQITVNRPDAEVRSRHINYTEKESPESRSASPATEAMSGLLPNASTPMRVNVVPFACPPEAECRKTGGKDAPGASIAITLGVVEDAPKTRVVEHVDLVTAAFSPDGAAKGQQRQTADVTIHPPDAPNPDGSPARSMFEVLSQIALKPGRYQLRLAANNTTTDKVGSVFVDVDVPDFANLPLSLSGIVLDATPKPISAPDGALASLFPVTPTIERTFTAASTVAAFMRVYQGAKGAVAPVTVKTTIADDHGAIVSASTTALKPEQFGAGRSTDFRYDLPLGTLKPGAHLLTFEATAGKATARRDVIFAVK